MSSDILCHPVHLVREKLSDSRAFSLQLDESIDISKKCRLLNFIGFIDDSIIEQYLACSELFTTLTGADKYDFISSILEQNELS